MAAMDAPWWALALAGAVVLYALCALYGAGLPTCRCGACDGADHAGDLSARAGVNGQDESGPMAQSLDRMVLRSPPWWRTSSNAALVANAGRTWRKTTAPWLNAPNASRQLGTDGCQRRAAFVGRAKQRTDRAQHSDAPIPPVRKAADSGAEPWRVPCSR